MAAWLLLVLVPLCTTPARALPFTLDLPELVGPVGDRLDRTASFSRSAQFDFGQPFSEVSSVALEIDASVRAAEYDFCGFTYAPQPCVHTFDLWGFSSLLDTEGAASPFFVFTYPGLSYGDPMLRPAAARPAPSTTTATSDPWTS